MFPEGIFLWAFVLSSLIGIIPGDICRDIYESCAINQQNIYLFSARNDLHLIMRVDPYQCRGKSPPLFWRGRKFLPSPSEGEQRNL